MSRFFLFFAAIFWSSAFEREPGMTFEQMSTHTTLSRYHAAVWLSPCRHVLSEQRAPLGPEAKFPWAAEIAVVAIRGQHLVDRLP